MTLKICLSEEQLTYLEFCFDEVIKKKVHLKTYLLSMFAEKYPNLKLSYEFKNKNLRIPKDLDKET
jgi:hypothetical protein